LNLDWEMFDTLESVATFYKGLNKGEIHRRIYDEFTEAAKSKQPALASAFQATEGFGELAFAWNWYLTVSAATEGRDCVRFLEVGVYKGRSMALVQLAADLLGKKAEIWGVTPLSTAGDQYSGYADTDYLAAIRDTFRRARVTQENAAIIPGLSQDAGVLTEAAKHAPYDILYIDGCHDYAAVVSDIRNYVPLLRVGGYLVMDDASLFLESPAGQFKGHPDVGRAIKDCLDGRTDMEHLFAVGHNRVWIRRA
jgi:Methyltransferase domain